jgi:hypothetical protein
VVNGHPPAASRQPPTKQGRICKCALAFRLWALSFLCILPVSYKRMLMPEEKDLDSRARGYRIRRSIMDYGMGAIIFCLGIFFLLAPKLGVVFGVEDMFRYLFAGLCILYGLFRVYRGYKKNYFN